MSEKPLKRYIFASDFDQTLTFNDTGYVLSELVGIPIEEFERTLATSTTNGPGFWPETAGEVVARRGGTN